MSPQMILPVFDPACRRVFHLDKLGAQGQLVALEIWNRATGRDLGARRLTVYRCTRCGGYHVAAKVVQPALGFKQGPVVDRPEDYLAAHSGGPPAR
ncbi:hypothetical protein [Planctomyces sp. SH-PL62]|uniref:hypothetical protein n=1 Tax=Planctomyces sp. SH-PL62 TaxID=1636152 RepID=UPI00078E378F|nr:hypothetical protein [Planctomyces sp. SH-PL62]AMV39141.1 hypothetical protein VT85_17010 [Planctomyces sp. SH-PL62]